MLIANMMVSAMSNLHGSQEAIQKEDASYSAITSIFRGFILL